jgi:hypothetical protein
MGPSFQRSGPGVVGTTGVRGGGWNGGWGGGWVHGPTHVIGPRGVTVVSPHFFRPYYAFRPQFSLGFGLWAGYPIAYPYYNYGYPYYPYYYGYGYSYPSAYPAPYNYAPDYSSDPSYPTMNTPTGTTGNSGDVQASRNSGGLSFEITPSDAEIYVDGQFEGPVSNFTPSSAPLTLTPGRHHVEIRASGYQVMSFDADVVAGQVIPYQGTMQPGH